MIRDAAVAGEAAFSCELPCLLDEYFTVHLRGPAGRRSLLASLGPHAADQLYAEVDQPSALANRVLDRREVARVGE